MQIFWFYIMVAEFKWKIIIIIITVIRKKSNDKLLKAFIFEQIKLFLVICLNNMHDTAQRHSTAPNTTEQHTKQAADGI